MKRLNNYLNEIQFSQREIIEFVLAIIVLAITIFGYFISSKRNMHLESVLRKLTGKKYTVRILKGTKEPNGFCFGGIGRSIFLTEGLVKIMNERQVIAVCLHEIGHITNYDTITSTGVSLASVGVAGIILKSASNIMEKPATSGKAKVICGVIFVLLSAIIIRVAPGILLGKLHEYRADNRSVKYGYGKDLIEALNILENWVKNYKFKIYGEPTKFEKLMDKIQGILDVHPSMENRVKRLFEQNKLYENIHDKDINGIKKLCKEVL